MNAPTHDPNARFQEGLRLRGAGRLEEALAIFHPLAEAWPNVAGARQARGLTLCNLGRFDEGLADLRAAVALEPRNPDLHASLGMVLFVLDRLEEARGALDRALTLQPAHADALNNLSLVLKAAGDFGGAERAARKALASRGDFPQARVNLAYALLSQGKFAEAWEPFCARPHAQANFRDPGMFVAVPHDERLPAAPAPVVLHGEQGLGDALFYLRFAPQLQRRGHRLAFWGDARLHPILARTGIFEHLMAAESQPAPGLAVVWAGDLPRLLHATDPAAFPPALAIAPEPARREAMRERLLACGPAPWIGLTWRAGLPRTGKVVLAKALAPEALGAALRGAAGTLVSLQRRPAPGEREALAAAAGAEVHDFSAANEDLEEALALLDLLDDYVAVSNTNVHLRAGLGKGARILVPWPPEWRWLVEAPRSPWFPAMPVHRQSARGDWGDALAGLRRELDAARG